MSSVGCKGNVLLDQLVGSQIVLCPYRSTANTTLPDGTVVTGLGALMEQYAQTLRSIKILTYNPVMMYKMDGFYHSISIYLFIYLLILFILFIMSCDINSVTVSFKNNSI